MLWNTIAVLRLLGGMSVTPCLPITTLPESGISKPATILSVVVFPQPEGPSR